MPKYQDPFSVGGLFCILFLVLPPFFSFPFDFRLPCPWVPFSPSTSGSRALSGLATSGVYNSLLICMLCGDYWWLEGGFGSRAWFLCRLLFLVRILIPTCVVSFFNKGSFLLSIISSSPSYMEADRSLECYCYKCRYRNGVSFLNRSYAPRDIFKKKLSSEA